MHSTLVICADARNTYTACASGREQDGFGSAAQGLSPFFFLSSFSLSLSLNACACVLYQRGGVWDGLGNNPVLQIKGHACSAARGRSKVKHRQHVQQVSTEDGRAMAETLDMAFYETSAKDKSMVDEAFFALTRDIKARLGAACVRVCTGGWSCVCGCACARARAPWCPWLPFVLPPWILVQSTARSVLLESRAL